MTTQIKTHTSIRIKSPIANKIWGSWRGAAGEQAIDEIVDTLIDEWLTRCLLLRDAHKKIHVGHCGNSLTSGAETHYFTHPYIEGQIGVTIFATFDHPSEDARISIGGELAPGLTDEDGDWIDDQHVHLPGQLERTYKRRS